MKINKKIRLNLVGQDGNAYALMGAFKRQARQEGWTALEIDAVMQDCMSGDYDHLVGVISDYCESPDSGH